MIRWVLYLQAYDFVIEYRPGKANGNADALSRIPWEQLQAEAAKDPIQEKKSTKNRKKTEQPESKIEKEEVFFTPNTTVEGEDESNVMKYESEAFKERSKLELDERNLNNSSPCIIDEQKGEKQKFSAITESPFDKESIIRHQKADPQLLGKMEYLAEEDEDKSSDESEDIEGSEDIGGEPEEEKDESSENSSNQENQNGGTEANEHEQGKTVVKIRRQNEDQALQTEKN
ncbi:uncharacterized protein [Clytia hemisphaerica]|uniref:uncharacterized protein n=1 Tax=Clytia hemisphaerica TaxID=252671 RepID=UPI0034D628A9